MVNSKKTIIFPIVIYHIGFLLRYYIFNGIYSIIFEYDWFFGISRRIFGSVWWANHGGVIHFSYVEGFDPSPYLKFGGSMINRSLINRISHSVL